MRVVRLFCKFLFHVVGSSLTNREQGEMSYVCRKGRGVYMGNCPGEDVRREYVQWEISDSRSTC